MQFTRTAAWPVAVRFSRRKESRTEADGPIPERRGTQNEGRWCVTARPSAPKPQSEWAERNSWMRVDHDGSRHHGVGIAPTVPVSRTLAGVAAGRDEILEHAVQIVRN
jgi:hypothetical protein